MYEHPFLDQLAVTREYCNRLSEYYSQEAKAMKQSGNYNSEIYYLRRKQIVDDLAKTIENAQSDLGEKIHAH